MLLCRPDVLCQGFWRKSNHVLQNYIYHTGGLKGKSSRTEHCRPQHQKSCQANRSFQILLPLSWHQDRAIWKSVRKYCLFRQRKCVTYYTFLPAFYQGNFLFRLQGQELNRRQIPYFSVLNKYCQ